MSKKNAEKPTPGEKAAPGRPTLYTEPVVREILERLMDGQSMRRICADDHMPSRSTVLDWLEEHEDFRAKCARAREVQAHDYAAETIEIADDDRHDWAPVHNADGELVGVKVDGDHIKRSALRVSSRQWYAAKLAPKKYGDSVQLKHADADGNNPPAHDDTAAAARLAAILADVQRRVGGEG